MNTQTDSFYPDNRTAMCVDHMPVGASDVDYVLSGKVGCAEHHAEAHRRDMFTGYGWTVTEPEPIVGYLSCVNCGSAARADALDCPDCGASL